MWRRSRASVLPRANPIARPDDQHTIAGVQETGLGSSARAARRATTAADTAGDLPAVQTENAPEFVVRAPVSRIISALRFPVARKARDAQNNAACSSPRARQ